MCVYKTHHFICTSGGNISRGRLLLRKYAFSCRKLLALNGYSDNLSQSFKMHPWECIRWYVFSSFCRRQRSSFEVPFQVISAELSHFLKFRSCMTNLIILLEPSSSHHTSPLRHLHGGPQWPQSGSQGLSLSDSSRHFHCSSGSSVLPAQPHRGLDSPDPSQHPLPLLHSISFVLLIWCSFMLPCVQGTYLLSLSGYTIFWCRSFSTFSRYVFAPATGNSLVQGPRSVKICGGAQQLLSGALTCGSPIFAQSECGSNFPPW